MDAKVSRKQNQTIPQARDAQTVRELLAVAAAEFSTRGFAGARLEEIARAAGITRAMIYYYFGGREGLYVAVLEDAYRAIWQAEHAIDTSGQGPEDALRKLVEFRVGYYIRNPTFVALVSIENQHEARYLKRSRSTVLAAAPSLEHTAAVLARGQAAGLFRKDVDVVDLYQVIVSLGFFNVSNRHTFGAIFGRSASDAAHVRRFVSDVVLRYVAAHGSADRETRPQRKRGRRATEVSAAASARRTRRAHSA
jgi:TetR/AcrR family transcriptional regulator